MNKYFESNVLDVYRYGKSKNILQNLKVGRKNKKLIREIKLIYSHYNYKTKILAASIRTKNHVTQSALAGADVVTIPPKVFSSLVNHNLTDKGLKIFNSDWQKSGQKIL